MNFSIGIETIFYVQQDFIKSTHVLLRTASSVTDSSVQFEMASPVNKMSISWSLREIGEFLSIERFAVPALSGEGWFENAPE
ncbi:hypothetical protein K0M31_013388 [Melipona bicolor]|uniref:Uncharacterized protein n=1 Tax=Melipona bicolor TaxID=60889 RepID=A0AA40FIN8_9HYME|nr:hypothetical protein K0M31_013388 [Melipona bicolor]